MEMENLIINSVDDVLYEEAKSVWWDHLTFKENAKNKEKK